MRNELTEFKAYLQFVSPEDQLFEIQCMTDDLINDNTPYFYI